MYDVVSHENQDDFHAQAASIIVSDLAPHYMHPPKAGRDTSFR